MTQTAKIKVCGLTSVEEADWIKKYHVDYAGMVLFFPKSKRNVSIGQAKQILERLGSEVQKVAVVVSPTVEQIRELQELCFDLIQIHGLISKDVLDVLHTPFLKAYNGTQREELEIYRRCEQCAGFVFDAQVPGSGETFDWNGIQDMPVGDKMVLLAGGLNPENVSVAINVVHPYGVDVSSGVELDSGIGKDPEKIRRFVEAVRGGDNKKTGIS